MPNTTKSPYANWPILGPLLILLTSPEVALAVLTVLANWFFGTYPAFEPIRVPLMGIVTASGGLIMSGYIAGRLAELKGVPFLQLPFWSPIHRLLKSSKFWTGFATLVAAGVVALVPALESVRPQLIFVIGFVGATLIGGIAYEDGKGKESVAPLPPAVSVYTDANTSQPLPDDEQLTKLVAILLPLLLGELNKQLLQSTTLPKAGAGPSG